MENLKRAPWASSWERKQKVQGLSVHNTVNVSKILVKGHEIEIVSVFRLYFQCNISGILRWKIRVLNLFCNYIRAEGTREKVAFWGLMHLPALLLLFHCLCYQQLSSVIYSILSWSTFWEIKRHLLLGRKVMTNLDSILKSIRHYFANKCPSSQSYGFSSSHVWMWKLDYKESWAPKNWCFWTVVLEKTLESPLDSKEIQPVHSKGDQSCIFIGRTDAEAEATILWPPNVKNWFIEKDPDAGKDWRQEEKGMREDEMVVWHH